jgi:ornithine--oxo-acid transaminase
LVGIELGIGHNNAHEICSQLVEEGILCKESRPNIIRLAPPLTITKEEMDWGLEKIEKVFKEWKGV